MYFQKAFIKDLSKKSNLSTSPQALFFFSRFRKSWVVVHHQYVSAHWHWHTCLWHEILEIRTTVQSCSQRTVAIRPINRSQIAPYNEEGVVAKSIHFGLKGSLHQHEMSKVKTYVIKSTITWFAAHLIFPNLYTHGFQDLKIFTRVCA